MNDFKTVTGVDASEIGLKPGEWPEKLQRDGREYRRMTSFRDQEGELQFVRYVGYDGPKVLVLEVFND